MRLTYIFSTIILTTILLTGCNKCGEDVFLGEYNVLGQSKTDWFPYEGVDTLSFRSMEGEILNLVVDNRKQETETQAFRQICKGTSLNDIAEEVYTTEIYVVEYSGIHDGDTYFLSISILVDRYVPPTNTNIFKAFDKIVYNSNFQGYEGNQLNLLKADITLVANDRGESNTITNEDLWYDGALVFEDEVLINGQLFRDVWIDETTNGPGLYVQKGEGIVAFLGFDDKIWIKR